MKRVELNQAKVDFVKTQGEKESRKLALLADNHHHSSGTYRDSVFYFLRWPSELDVRLARKDHVCCRV